MEFDAPGEIPNLEYHHSSELEQWITDNVDLINEMLQSSDELTRLYGEAYQDGCFIREFSVPDGEPGESVTLVGDVQAILNAQNETGRYIDIAELSLPGALRLAFVGEGATSSQRIIDGLSKVDEVRGKDARGEQLNLYSSTEIDGYSVKAFIPRIASQAKEWTVEVTRLIDGTPIRLESVPMLYAPLYGIDAGDAAALQNRIDDIISELIIADFNESPDS